MATREPLHLAVRLTISDSSPSIVRNYISYGFSSKGETKRQSIVKTVLATFFCFFFFSDIQADSLVTVMTPDVVPVTLSHRMGENVSYLNRRTQ